MARLDKTWKIEKDGAALATELHHVLDVSHRQAKGIMDAGCVTLNGNKIQVHGHRLKVGDEVTVKWDPDTEYKERNKPRKDMSTALFTLLWEDKHLVFVDKPAGLLTVPTETSSEDPCLAEAITEHYRSRGFKRFHLFIVHRLDRFTSGVLVFAKTPEALNTLKDVFEKHHLNRVYKAILVGELPENAGILADKLLEHSRSLRMSVAEGKDKDSRFAKKAVTHYRVLERFPGHTLVEIKLETGRRNQIRVQFADRGFPILGDMIYGKASELIDRQALHAELLGFEHPLSEEPITVQAPMPSDMEKVLRILRSQQRLQRAEAGLKGEEGIYKPKATKERRTTQTFRAKRFDEPREGAGSSERGPREDRPESAQRPRRTEAGPKREGGTYKPKENRPPRTTSSFRPKRDEGPREGAAPGRRAPQGDRPESGQRSRRPEGGPKREGGAYKSNENRPPRAASSFRPKRDEGPREGAAPVKRGPRVDRPESGERPRREGAGPKREGGTYKPKETRSPRTAQSASHPKRFDGPREGDKRGPGDRSASSSKPKFQGRPSGASGAPSSKGKRPARPTFKKTRKP
jgi:23S rRNA pseudouridine1911/1915/1917 synthase